MGRVRTKISGSVGLELRPHDHGTYKWYQMVMCKYWFYHVLHSGILLAETVSRKSRCMELMGLHHITVSIQTTFIRCTTWILFIRTEQKTRQLGIPPPKGPIQGLLTTKSLARAY